MSFKSLLLTLGLTIAPLVGFGPLGPVAGALAPWVQSLFGTPWTFRIAQTFAMKFAPM